MKNVLAKYSKGLRFQFVFQHKAKWPVKWMCSALQVSMAGFYRWQSRNGLS
jgi:putative transposase